MSNNKEIPILEAKNIHKWYGKIHALNNFDFEIYPGETIGLVGDNGAGKSTFVKIIAGVISKTSGEIYWNGKKINITSIQDARKLGIETVYQEQALVNQLSVAKNIFLGRVPTKYGFLKSLDNEKMRQEARKATEALGLKMAPETEIRFCSGGERQGVAVARALLFEADLVILDEPTRAISAKGVRSILNFIKELKSQGIAVILISHIFPQIFPVTDRFIVLSRGEIVTEKKQEDTSTEELTEILVDKS